MRQSYELHVWIETQYYCIRVKGDSVTPCVGVWIETRASISLYRSECNLQIFLCLFLEKLNMPQDTPVTKAS